jgi:hypothetical protein
VAPDAAVMVAVDDTLLQRWGRKVYGCFYHHDATANSEKAAVAWGNNWVVIGICVKLPCLERTVCLPVLFRLWQPRRAEYAKANKPDPQRPGKPVMARELVDLLVARLAGRRIDLVGDAAYATEAWRGIDASVTITSRLRCNAAIYAPAPERTGKRGRPRRWGARLGRLAEIATDPATSWVEHTVRRYGKTETLKLAVTDCLWEPLGADTPIRVILVHDDTKPAGYQLALITTDLTSTPAQIVERYSDRWSIEVCFEEAKHQAGVGDAEKPRRERGTPDRPVPVPDDDHHHLLVRTARTSPRRHHRTPRPRPVVPVQDQPIVRRHARQAPPHPDRRPIFTRTAPRPPTNRKSSRSNKPG